MILFQIMLARNREFLFSEIISGEIKMLFRHSSEKIAWFVFGIIFLTKNEIFEMK